MKEQDESIVRGETMPSENLPELSERLDPLTEACKQVIHKASKHHKTIEESVLKHNKQIERTFSLVDQTTRHISITRERN
jgi:hypothetical protein